MTTILRVQASARTTGSVSRKLSEAFVDAWRSAEADVAVIDRDLGRSPPPAVSEPWIAAAFTPDDQRNDEQRKLLALSDELIGELERADIIVIGTPMYNYGMPAALKAWFDQVIRINRTFTFDLARGDRPLEPILCGKCLVVLTSCGEFGFEPGGLNEGAGHLVPHIKTTSKYLGADHISHVGVEFQEFGDERHEASKEQAFHDLAALVPALQSRFAKTAQGKAEAIA